MGRKDGCKGRLEAATISDILYIFGQGNYIFIKEKLRNSQGIFKSDVCGNHGFMKASSFCWKNLAVQIGNYTMLQALLRRGFSNRIW